MVLAAAGSQECASCEAVLQTQILCYLLFQEDLAALALLHPQASLCCSLTLQLHRVPQIQFPFPLLCSLLPGALLVCSYFLPQLQ